MHAFWVLHLVVDMRTCRMSGAAEMAKLITLLQTLAHSGRDPLEMSVKVVRPKSSTVMTAFP